MAVKPSIKLFSAYFGPFPLLPKAEYVIPVEAGAALARHHPQMPGDDSGDSISRLNPLYSELTVAYWIIKNYPREGIDAWGLVHYRRYFIETKYSFPLRAKSRRYFRTSQAVLDRVLTDKLYRKLQIVLSDHDVIVQRPSWARKEKGAHLTIIEAYRQAHIIEDYEITMQVVREKYPAFSESIEPFNMLRKMSYNNMMIARWNVWDDYLTFLFDVLEEVQKRINLEKTGYQTRVLGFLAERLHNLFIYHNRYRVAGLTLALFEDKL